MKPSFLAIRSTVVGAMLLSVMLAALPVGTSSARSSGASGSYQPDSVFRDCEQCPEMVVVPAGRFQMGDLNDVAPKNEKPVHTVKIAYPFAVGKYEVTFAEWDACVADGGCTHQPDDEGWGRGNRPVINISWQDAQQYVAWLSRKTGHPYRLLSEAEWEYVARAGTVTIHWWGGGGIDEADQDHLEEHNHANYGKETCCGRRVIGADRWENTAPVGSFAPNPLGLFDTAGNVHEWVEDCWNASYKGAPGDGSAWTSSGDCDLRVLRGGSWLSTPLSLRSAYRFRFDLGLRYNFIGFRLARTITS